MEQGLEARAIIAAMAQSLSFVLVHVVFSTKDRASLLDGEVCGQLHADLATVARNLDCECYRVGGMADHLGMPGQTVVGYADLLNVLDRLLAEFGGVRRPGWRSTLPLPCRQMARPVAARAPSGAGRRPAGDIHAGTRRPHRGQANTGGRIQWRIPMNSWRLATTEDARAKVAWRCDRGIHPRC